MTRAVFFRTVSIAACALIALVAAASAQEAKFTVTDDCTAFAFSPDGSRIVYAAQRYGKAEVSNGRKKQKVPIEEDDLWEVGMNGHKRRLVDGSKMITGSAPVSFSIQDIQIAPDNRHMALQIATQTAVPKGPEDVHAKSGEYTDLLDGDGKEIEIQGTKSSEIQGALNAVWLADGQTVVYMKEASGSQLYTLAYVRPSSGASGALLPGHSFVAVAWNPEHEVAAAIEPTPGDLSGSIRLVWIDLAHRTERALTKLDGYDGHLTLSPSATQIAYYRNGDTIEIRPVAHPDQVTRFEVPFGRYEWAPDEKHLLLKRGPDNQTNQLIWISLPGGQYQDAFHGLIYHDFHISPGGQWVALTEPGEQILKLYPSP
jgi:hypothetical protein